MKKKYIHMLPRKGSNANIMCRFLIIYINDEIITLWICVTNYWIRLFKNDQAVDKTKIKECLSFIKPSRTLNEAPEEVCYVDQADGQTHDTHSCSNL